MLDADLAAVYGVTTTRLNQQVQRNIKRFPPEFMFQLTKQEFDNLMLQFATSSWGGRRKLPYAFTGHGTVMAASVLNTAAAVQASIYVVKAFVQLRSMVRLYHELEKRMTALENKVGEQGEMMVNILKVLRQFIAEVNEDDNLPEGNKQERKPIGFKRKEGQ